MSCLLISQGCHSRLFSRGNEQTPQVQCAETAIQKKLLDSWTCSNRSHSLNGVPVFKHQNRRMLSRYLISHIISGRHISDVPQQTLQSSKTRPEGSAHIFAMTSLRRENKTPLCFSASDLANQNFTVNICKPKWPPMRNIQHKM